MRALPPPWLLLTSPEANRLRQVHPLQPLHMQGTVDQSWKRLSPNNQGFEPFS